ncbi:MAG: YgaP-like transmembrane domain, partial [Cyclobacteriaceae bacterium]
MKKNMGNADRIIRTVIVLIFATLYYTGTVTGLIGIA